ncbi:unnamed protein product [Cuscuta campestris]|uniref:Retrotransposon gag domain-containing protein n=1 Tax=Cuscuta campestris TaxID=132261 RepID=A0A484KGE2_9ASTE|nr:unnamed protein product [Cuscuta campestris]
MSTPSSDTNCVTELSQSMVQMQRDMEARFSCLDSVLSDLQEALHVTSSSARGKKPRDDDANPHSGGYTPRPRLEAPRCDGSDPLRWLYKVKEYFEYYDTPPDDRLRRVRMMLDGPAADWFRWRKNNNLLDGWADFITKFKLRFDMLHYVDYFGQLARMPQTRSVMDYETAFEKSCRMLQTPVKPTYNPCSILLLHVPSLLPYGPLLPTLKRAELEPTPTSPFRTLTRAERAAKDAKELCYNCDQKWSRNHRCSPYLLMILDDDDTEDTTDGVAQDEVAVTARISSLNSMAGVTTPRSLRLFATVSDQSLVVLIDGGSTHNFIHPTLVERLRLPVLDIVPFKVYVGNGAYLLCSKQCMDQLGRVSHDYAQLTMKFVWNSTTIVLQGETQLPKAISVNCLYSPHTRQELTDCFEVLLLEDMPKGSDGVEFPPYLPSPQVCPQTGQWTTGFACMQGLPLSSPVHVHAVCTILQGGTPLVQGLVEWSDGTLDDATWEPVEHLHQNFPHLHLEDNVVLEEVGNVMSPTSPQDDRLLGGVALEQVQRSQRSRKPLGWQRDYSL